MKYLKKTEFFKFPVEISSRNTQIRGFLLKTERKIS